MNTQVLIIAFLIVAVFSFIVGFIFNEVIRRKKENANKIPFDKGIKI